MLNPGALIALARSLVKDAEQIQDADAHLHRAVSTAYYAVFHLLLQLATKQFMGDAQMECPAARILYRGFDHSKMRTVCDNLQKQKLPIKYSTLLGKDSMSATMRRFAASFIELQDRRHAADYDPKAQFTPSSVNEVIDQALLSISFFMHAEPAEQTEVLTLLLVGVRT